MDKAKRQAVIAAIYKAKAGVFAFAWDGVLKPVEPPRPKPARIALGMPEPGTAARPIPQWAKRPDAVSGPLARISRKERVSPLTLIAEKWPHAPKLAAKGQP